jgi:integrase/recombinase XerC
MRRRRRAVDRRRAAGARRYLDRGGTRELAAPSVKQRLAAIRHLFDWLVTGQVVPVNPAASVRGPRPVVTSGQTPVFDPSEARALLDSIDTSTVVGLRDRALIGLMVCSFARIGAALGMTVEDVFTQNRRLWVRRERRQAARDAVPSQPRGIPDCLSRLRRAARRSQRAAVPYDWPGHGQAHAHGPAASERLCDDRPAPALPTRLGNHSFRATGITAYPRTAARSRRPRRWRTTPRRAPRSSTIGGATSSASMRSSEL